MVPHGPGYQIGATVFLDASLSLTVHHSGLDLENSTSLKKTFNAKEFSDLLGQIRARLEYTEVDGNQVHVK